MRRRLMLLPLVLCLAALTFGQAGPGFTPLLDASGNPVSTSGLSYIDATVVDGDVYEYQVTAYNAAGESTPLTSGAALIPATGTHTVTLTWGASASAGVSYHLYRTQIVKPGPATGSCNATVN